VLILLLADTVTLVSRVAVPFLRAASQLFPGFESERLLLSFREGGRAHESEFAPCVFLADGRAIVSEYHDARDGVALELLSFSIRYGTSCTIVCNYFFFEDS